ncbi:MAG: hypothetical protein ACI4RG_04750, partial [Huintestinicola sp.]
MKKLVFAAAAVLLCAAMGTSVSADLIVEPIDSFYMENMDNIDSPFGRDGRKFILTSETKVYADPEGKEAGKLSAGTSPAIKYVYTDKNGGLWGGYYDYSGDDEVLWISIDGLEAVYDNYAFSEEHKDKITEGKPDGAESLKEDGTIYLWEYPGSTECIAMETHPDDFGNYVKSYYTDEIGGKWGYVNYIWGASGWFYLTDPADPAPYGE